MKISKFRNNKFVLLKNFKKVFFTSLVLFSIIIFTTFFHLNTKDEASTFNSLNEGNLDIFNSSIKNSFTPQIIIINKLELIKSIKIKELTEQKRKLLAEQNEKQTLQDKNFKINTLENFFIRYSSPMKGYSELIINKAQECGGNYKILVGIAAIESSLGNSPYKQFNPYGYLDGVQYGSWEESLEHLSCVISTKFIKPCNSDLYCIINKYGGSDTNKSQWVNNVTKYINQIQ